MHARFEPIHTLQTEVANKAQRTRTECRTVRLITLKAKNIQVLLLCNTIEFSQEMWF